MGSVVKSLDKAINSMELQKISEVMEKFESQFEDLDVRTSVSIILQIDHSIIEIFVVLFILILTLSVLNYKIPLRKMEMNFPILSNLGILEICGN